jgi:hypothetical protein
MNSGERPRHPDLLPHVTRRDSARQLVWGMLIDLPSVTPVPEISGASPRAQPFISPPASRRARELVGTDQAPFRSQVVMVGHELPARGLSTVHSRLSGIARYDIPTTTTGVVTHCGRICLGHKKFNFGTVPSSPARPSASKKSTTTSGWSALWIMILGYSACPSPSHCRTSSDGLSRCWPDACQHGMCPDCPQSR